MKTPTTIHQAMMEDIIANPGDLSLRLIYADYLCDSGSEEYAHFIRGSITEDLLITDQYNNELHYRQWFGVALPDNTIFGRWRRQSHGTWVELMTGVTIAGKQLNTTMTIIVRNGFIEEVNCTLQAFCDHGPRLCQHQPVVSVKITDRSPDQNYPGYYYWASSHPPSTLTSPPMMRSSHFITDQMMRMENDKIENTTRANRLIGDTVELVNAKLSSRLIEWARSQPLDD